MAASAQVNLLVDGDFSVTPGSGTPAPTISSNGTSNTSYSYVSYASTNSVLTATGIGGAGGWTAYNGSADGTPQNGSAVYFENTVGNTSQTWIPPAAASNVNGYVVQLDTTSAGGAWNTGNALSQTVTVTTGDDYALTFSINTEAGGGKSHTSAADVMVTNADNFKASTSSGTVSTSSATNLNAKTYGDVMGYQYTVSTTNQANGATAATWATYTIDFTATSNNLALYLADDPISANSNISLEQISLVQVPEPPQSAIVLLLGVAILMTLRRLRPAFLRHPLFAPLRLRRRSPDSC